MESIRKTHMNNSVSLVILKFCYGENLFISCRIHFIWNVWAKTAANNQQLIS